MKSPRFLLAAFLSASLACCLVHAADSKPAPQKSPADEAAAEFFKLRDAKDVAPSPERFQKVLTAGMTFLVQNPTHKNVGAVINSLSTFGMTMRQKGQGPQRAAWLAQLKYETLNQRLKDGASDEVKTAIAALDAGIAGMEVREAFNRDNLSNYRDKIDALAQMPGGGKFLLAQEAGYVEVLKNTKMSQAEEHLKSLQAHPDKKIAEMATDELNLIQILRQPYELKFTAVDGQEVDFAKLRGKVVLLSFWSAKNEKSTKEQEELRQLHWNYKKRNFEVVGVACDKEADREAMMKYLKDNKVAWPQYFDGQGTKNEFGQKLGVKNIPANFLFDQKGMLVATGVRIDKMEPDLKKLLGIK
ncbi:MAG TPA: TlpA disulfide reductase family protein [Opitutaceae bacterium]|nr:TlpA disulfide reductase family protein [Opitutaceae bacterium]